MSRRPTRGWARGLRQNADVVALSLAVLVAMTPFGRSFVGLSYLGAMLLAIVVPTTITVVTRSSSFVLAGSAQLLGMLAVLVVVVLPHTTAYGIPQGRTATALGDLLTSAVQDFAAAGVPSTPRVELLGAPVLLGLTSAAGASMLAVRTRWFLAPAVPALVAFVVATMLSPGTTMLSLLVCGSFAAAILLALMLRASSAPMAGTGAARTAIGPLSTLAVASTGLAVAVGALVGTAQGIVHDEDRFALRQLLDPPVVIADGWSPLTLVRWKKDEVHADDELFAVTFDELPVVGPDAAAIRIPLAYLSSYDASTWSVDGLEFHRAGVRIPRSPGEPSADGQLITQHYEVRPALPTSFVPSLPDVVTIQATSTPLAFSELTGTLVRADGKSGTASYDVTSRVRSAVTRRCPMGDLPLGGYPARLDRLVAIPADLPSLVDYRRVYRWAEPDPGDPMPGLAALECLTRDENGEYVNNPAARQGHNIARLAQVATGSHIGSEEQYASLFALAARMNGLPSRVVVGYELASGAVEPGRPVVVTAADVASWPEVFVGGTIGWLALDPAGPPQEVSDQTAAEVPAEPASAPQPSPPAAGNERPVPTETPALRREPPRGRSWLLPIVALVLLAAGAIGTAVGTSWHRSRRRRARDPRRATLGAWSETRARLTLAGHRVGPGWTAQELAGSVGGEAESPLRELGDLVDRALYTTAQPPVDMGSSAWQFEGEIRRIVRVPRLRLLLHMVDVRSLIAGIRESRELGY